MSFVDDLKSIGKLSADQSNKIVDFLNASEKVSSKYLTENTVFFDSIALKGEVGKSVLKVLLFLTDVSIEEKGLDAGLQEVEKNFKDFFDGDQEIINCWDSAKLLLRRLDKFSLSRKELVLRTKFPHLHDFSIVCDARPIFDTGRTEIKKMIYPIILKLEDHDGKDLVFEVDEDKLKYMAREIDLAFRKLELLKKAYAK